MLHACEIRPRKDHRGVDLISDAPESFLIAGWRMIRPIGFRFLNAEQFGTIFP
jgi:hypothetical protein